MKKVKQFRVAVLMFGEKAEVFADHRPSRLFAEAVTSTLLHEGKAGRRVKMQIVDYRSSGGGEKTTSRRSWNQTKFEEFLCALEASDARKLGLLWINEFEGARPDEVVPSVLVDLISKETGQHAKYLALFAQELREDGGNAFRETMVRLSAGLGSRFSVYSERSYWYPTEGGSWVCCLQDLLGEVFADVLKMDEFPTLDDLNRISSAAGSLTPKRVPEWTKLC